MSTHQKTIDLGVQARELLASEAVKEAFVRMEEEQMRIIRDSSPESTQEREAAYLLLRSHRHLRDELEIMINRGKRAQSNLPSEPAPTTTRKKR
jgi:hypothetical protein